jgi:HEAT repeat protein
MRGRFVSWLLYDDTSRKQWFAYVGYSVLGREASPVVPEMINVISNFVSDPVSVEPAMIVLARVGPAGLPPLAALLADPQSTLRRQAAWLIGTMDNLGHDTAVAVQALVEVSGDKDRAVAGVAASALVAFGARQPELVIPALTNCLRHSQVQSRYVAANVLGYLRQEARAAIPALQEALVDDDALVRDAATNAIVNIAPELLVQAVGK